MMKNKKKTTTQIICQNLNLPKQTIFQDYKCTLESGFSFFGRLYIGQEHLMFVSNMFGIVKKVALTIQSISKVTEIVSQKISITGKCFMDPKAESQQFVFSGFKNSNAFKMVNALWKKQKLSLDVLNANNEQEADIGQKPAQSKSLDESNMQVNIFNPEIVETQKQKMVQVILPCSIEQFYNFFLSDDADLYPKSQHFQFKKATKIVVTPWKKNQQMNAETRQITAMLKVKGVPFKSEAPLTQIWLLTKHTPEQINVKTITQLADIPYSAYFTCQQHMIVTKQGQTKCKYVCSNAIVFNKSTYMKNTILTRTFADLKEDYTIWTENVKEKLEKLKKNAEESQKKKTKQHSIEVQFQADLQQGNQKIIQSPLLIRKKEAQVDIDLGNKIKNLENRIGHLTKVIALLLILSVASIIINLYALKGNKNPANFVPKTQL